MIMSLVTDLWLMLGFISLPFHLCAMGYELLRDLDLNCSCFIERYAWRSLHSISY